MTPNDYQQAALRTAPGDLPPERLLLNGLMGLNGEAGEAIDILKKHLFQGHELDTAHMARCGLVPRRKCKRYWVRP